MKKRYVCEKFFPGLREEIINREVPRERSLFDITKRIGYYSPLHALRWIRRLFNDPEVVNRYEEQYRDWKRLKYQETRKRVYEEVRSPYKKQHKVR